MKQLFSNKIWLKPLFKRQNILILLIGCILFTSRAYGQSAGEYTLKAVYIERFTRFVEWPDSLSFPSDSSKFHFVILGDNPFGDRMETSYRNTKIHNRAVKVTYIQSIDDLKEAHALFITRSNRFQISRIINKIKGRPILSITEIKNAAKKGIHINFTVSGASLQFEINHKATEESSLKMSFHLLQRAKIIE
ncbi:YfiR family protein [bacterium]|nr:YfiR family protein [bacterium]